MTIRSLTWFICFDMIRWYDSFDMIRYDSVCYPFCYDDLLLFSFIWDSVLMICSDWLCYDYFDYGWLLFWYVLFWCPSFSLVMEVPWPCHWGTNGMTLSVAVWLVHDVPILIWYDYESSSPLYVYILVMRAGVYICFVLWGAYGCILGYVLIWEDHDWVVRALHPLTFGS